MAVPTSSTRRAWLATLAIALFAALVASGCGTAEGQRYRSGGVGAGGDGVPPRPQSVQQPPAQTSAPSGFSTPRPARDWSRGVETSLDYAREWRSDDYLERQRIARAAREKAAKKQAERRARERANMRRDAARNRYNGSRGYPYVDRVGIHGITYRRIWQGPGHFILDGEPTWDGYAFRYAASSGAQVFQSSAHTRPRTAYEHRVHARRHGGYGH
jgi:hypothetical protein